MIDVRISDDELSKKKQRLSDLEGIIQGEKFTVDDLKRRIENSPSKNKIGGTSGANALRKMLAKHEDLLEMYKNERKSLRMEINAGKDLYEEVMKKYNSVKSLQEVVDDWWYNTFEEIEETIDDVNVTEGSFQYVEIELNVHTEPVEADMFAYHRRRDKKRPVTTRQHSHTARVRNGFIMKARFKDKERSMNLDDWSNYVEIKKREAEYEKKRERELERLRLKKLRRDNKKKTK